MFFDIEGYPMYLDPKTSESGLEYLFGVYFRIFNEPTFKKFLSVNHEEEKQSFEELNDMAKEFILNIEELCKVPVIMISTGPKREDTIIREYPL